MNRRRVHILFEHGSDQQPFGSGQIRLLRPLTHPSIGACMQITTSLEYDGQNVDAVIVDRLWRPDISPILAQNLLDRIHRASARLIYALDDNFLDMASEKKDWQLTKDQLWVVEFFLSQSDGVLVTTPALAERLAGLNSRIVVLPHALDERLLANSDKSAGKFLQKVLRAVRPANKRILIGYMGTFTHDDDLQMILPALRTVWRRHADEIEFQFIGVVGRDETWHSLKGLPIRMVRPKAGKTEYLSFMPWFSNNVHWDIALSPLQDTLFNRCKSDIKFLDYCAIGATGIYSRVSAYASTVRHRETGWLAENTQVAWSDALERLIEDAVLRKQIAHNATQYLYSERILARCATNWVRGLEDFLDCGPKTTI
jgi:processive 1,2-diacylglycerol beta-glucosyltransferase